MLFWDSVSFFSIIKWKKHCVCRKQIAPYWSFTLGSGAWHTLLVICQAVSGQGVPDVSLSSGTWLGCQLPPQAPRCSPAQGEMNSSWESWLARACSAGQRTGRCPRPIPVFLTSHAQRSAASTDGYPVCFPFEPSLSLFLSFTGSCALARFLFSQPHHLFMEQVQLPALMSGNDARTQKWQWVVLRVASVDNSSRVMEVKRLNAIRDAEVNYQS